MHKSWTIILVNFDNRHSLKYEYNDKYKEERRNKKTMSTLELLQLQNEHKDNFFGKGEDETQEQEGE